jgi:hypothetical protein
MKIASESEKEKIETEKKCKREKKFQMPAEKKN